MIWETILFVIACSVTVLAFWRKPKMTETEEFQKMEDEIKEWLGYPVAPSRVEEKLPTTAQTFVGVIDIGVGVGVHRVALSHACMVGANIGLTDLATIKQPKHSIPTTMDEERN